MRSIRISAFVCLSLLLAATSVRAQNLVANGNFESGLASWTTWSAAPSGFWDGVWLQSNDCDIWVPTNGCPYQGAISHAQKKGSGAGNAHGGLYQVVSVTPGRSYRVTGAWSGGVTGNVAGNNGSWWEVTVFDGVVSDAIIDAGVRGPQDVVIAKREANNLAHNGVFQFQWETFGGTFTAQSGTVTLALKTGSYSTFDAAGYHDQISVAEIVPAAAVPATSGWGIALLAALISLSYAVLKRRSTGRS